MPIGRGEISTPYRKTFLTGLRHLEVQPALKQKLQEQPPELLVEAETPSNTGDAKPTVATMRELATRGRSLFEVIDQKEAKDFAREGAALIADFFKHPLGKLVDRFGGPVEDALHFAQQLYEITLQKTDDEVDDGSLFKKNAGIKAFIVSALVEDPLARKAAVKFLQVLKQADAHYRTAINEHRANAPSGSALRALGANDRNLTCVDLYASELKNAQVANLRSELFRCVREELDPAFQNDARQLAITAAKIVLLFHDDMDNRFSSLIPDPQDGVHLDPKLQQAYQQMCKELLAISDHLPDGGSLAFSDWVFPTPPKLLQVQRAFAEWVATHIQHDHLWRDGDNASGTLNGGRIRAGTYHFNTEIAIGAMTAPGKGQVFKQFAPLLAGRLAAEYKYKSSDSFREKEGGDFAREVHDAVRERLPDLYRKARHGTLTLEEVAKSPSPFDALLADQSFLSEVAQRAQGKFKGHREGNDEQRLVRDLVANERVILFNTAVACQQHREGLRVGLGFHQLAEAYLREQSTASR